MEWSLRFKKEEELKRNTKNKNSISPWGQNLMINLLCNYYKDPNSFKVIINIISVCVCVCFYFILFYFIYLFIYFYTFTFTFTLHLQ